MAKKAKKIVKKTTRVKSFDPDTCHFSEACKHYKDDLEYAKWVFNRFFKIYSGANSPYDKQDLRTALEDFAYMLSGFEFSDDFDD